MATVQVNGSSAVTETSTVNNGGIAINVGNSSVLSTRSLGTADVGVFGSVVVSGINTEKALEEGEFAFYSDGVILRVTDSLATVSNNFLVNAADSVEDARSIHQISGIYIDTITSAIRDGTWNTFSGTFNPPVSGILVSFGEDAAANPSRAVPGELYFLAGSKTPVTGTYSPKNT